MAKSAQPPKSGHNSDGMARLEAFVRSIEQAEVEKREIAEAIADIYSEAKEAGLDVKALRKVVAMRRKTNAEIAAEQDTLDRYMHALGMLADTPLGEAAMREAKLSRLEAEMVRR